MWYSATKIGIPSIDMEHGNIDTMLSMIISGKVHQQFVGNLIDALLNHFESEEEIIRNLGKPFPEDHHVEHEQLSEQLLVKRREWSAGEIDAIILAQEVKLLLMSHVSEFDKFLGTD